MEKLNDYLCTYKGYVFANDLTTAEYIDSLQDFVIRDTDIFLVTYPKSGTIWAQQIITLICASGETEESLYPNNLERMPWLEYREHREDYALRPSPRMFASHLTPALMPPQLREKKAKVVYVMRNPKDNVVSYYHFCHIWAQLETPSSFQGFLEQYLAGHVGAASWFDHVRAWYTQRGQYNMLLLSYEDMVMDLRSAVEKLCRFLERDLSEEEITRVVEGATFKHMRLDPKANYEFVPNHILLKRQFMRKGVVGDWKNTFTVAQSEMFDQVMKERMKDLPFTFTWDSSTQ